MTPKLYAKLRAQIERQLLEQAGYQAQADAIQPGIDADQEWLDACQATLDASSDEDKEAAQSALDAAKATLAQSQSEQNELKDRARQIGQQIAQCEVELASSGLNLTQAEVDAILSAPVVPASVTMRQARLALLGAGLLDAVVAAVNSAGPAAQIEWEYAAVVDRNAGLIPSMASALGMTDAQIDSLFASAAAL